MHEAGLNPDFSCEICLKVFRNEALLRRHMPSHFDDKPHKCRFCGSQYKRSDALRRHWATCTDRIARNCPVPDRTPSGKRKQACDSCTVRKRACSTDQPCSECSMRRTECTYHSHQKSTGSDSPVSSIEDPERYKKCTTTGNNIIARYGLERPSDVRFVFLASFTQAAGLNEAYNFSLNEHDNTGDDDLIGGTMLSGGPVDNLSSSNPFAIYWDDFESNLTGSASSISPLRAEFDLTHREEASCDDEIAQETQIALKATALWDEWQMITNTVTTDGYGVSSTQWFEFFSFANATRFLSFFWTRWHHHCPIVHKATFKLSDCSNILFATICMVGACMSLSKEDHDSGRRLLDVIEEIIFSRPMLKETVPPITTEGGPLQRHQKVQTLQATCFICLLQKWEGNDIAKLRMQRHRFTAFVAAARAIGICEGTHSKEKLGPNFNELEWKAFMVREEMIRTFNHMFLVDSAFVIFHNSAPRMVLGEMISDLSCPEDVFEAASLDEFMMAIQAKPLPVKPLRLVDCVQNLFAESPDPQILSRLRDESALNLFTIVTALHGLLFHQLRALSPLSLTTGPFKRALDRWDIAWESSMKYTASNPINHSKVHAFPLHAKEFAALARIHIEKFGLPQMEWDAVLRSSGCVASTRSTELATFDQTDMDQIAKLILTVKEMNLG